MAIPARREKFEWEIVGKPRKATDIENPFKPEPATMVTYRVAGIGMWTIPVKGYPAKPEDVRKAIEEDIKSLVRLATLKGTIEV